MTHQPRYLAATHDIRHHGANGSLLYVLDPLYTTSWLCLTTCSRCLGCYFTISCRCRFAWHRKLNGMSSWWLKTNALPVCAVVSASGFGTCRMSLVSQAKAR